MTAEEHDRVESAIEEVLSRAGISYRKTKRAERLSGFDQIPTSWFRASSIPK